MLHGRVVRRVYLFIPILVVVVAAVYSDWFRRRDEDATPVPPILRRECEHRNYCYALTEPARVLKPTPEDNEVNAQHGLLVLKLFPHGPPDPTREV